MHLIILAQINRKNAINAINVRQKFPYIEEILYVNADICSVHPTADLMTIIVVLIINQNINYYWKNKITRLLQAGVTRFNLYQERLVNTL
jgi:hypothetical protein